MEQNDKVDRVLLGILLLAGVFVLYETIIGMVL